MGFLASLTPFPILRQLRQGQESSTFARLGQSRHVADLRLIFSVTIILIMVASTLALAFCFQFELMQNWEQMRANHNGWAWARLAFTAVTNSGAVIGAIGAVGCGVLAWTYQTGSTRLGVVDLFACEIATLCRVAAVTDMVPRYVRLFHNGSERAQRGDRDGDMPDDRFNPQESYFPVFETSVRDLQQLEADVVTNVTAFYTYMKVMRDGLRKLKEMHQPSVGATGDDDAWHRALCNVIYMQFLSFESGRKAIGDLVEFEPAQAEDICTILLSELIAYWFLRGQFSGDWRHRHLQAREAEYRRTLALLSRTVEAGLGPRWEKAKDLAEEIKRLYPELFPSEVTSEAHARKSDAAVAPADELVAAWHRPISTPP
jgi:hypothetical protein